MNKKLEIVKYWSFESNRYFYKILSDGKLVGVNTFPYKWLAKSALRRIIKHLNEEDKIVYSITINILVSNS